MTVSPVWHGAMLALLASALFGLSTPLVQRFGVGLGPFATAGLLYAGAALLGALLRQPVGREAQLRRGDVPRLLLMAAFGAVLGPVALAWGLQHTSGASASLMLTLEALFTAALARVLYREALDARVRAAMALILCGGVLLVIDQGLSGRAGLAGLLAVLVATMAWGADNTISRALAERDPGQVVMVKAALGASASGLLAVLAGESVPAWTAVAALLAVGASGYGLSLRFYLLAQRTFGAARTGSVFALAPFLGAVAADAPVVQQGAAAWLLSQCGPDFTLLVYGTASLAAVDRVAPALRSLLKTVCVLPQNACVPEEHPHQTTLLHDTRGLFAERYDAQDGSAWLLRPDHHLCARWRAPTAAQVAAAMNRCLALQPA